MSRSDSRSPLEKLVGAAVSILIAALAIYFAVRLIESVLFAFVGIVVVVATIGGAIAFFRARYRSW